MKKILSRIGVLAAGVLLVCPGAMAGSGETIPLKILSKKIGEQTSYGGQDRPSTDVILELRNESDRTLTAWRVSCLQAESNGNFSVASVEGDFFLELEDDTLEDPSQAGPLEPGGTRAYVFPRPMKTPAEPYAAMSCGVDAVVFADASFAGVPSVAHRLFEARAQLAADAAEVIERLSRILDGRDPSLDPPLSEKNRYAEILHVAALRSRSGEGALLEELLAELREEVTVIESHLPSGWPHQAGSLR